VIDDNIITSRKPEDVEAFTQAIIAQFEAGQGVEQISDPVETST